MAIRILSSENITGKLTLTGQQELLELTRGGASDSKWFFSADSLKLYIAEDTSASNNIKMTLTDAGNVGIGTVSPDQTGYGYKTLTIMGGTTAGYAGVLELLTPSTDANGQNLGIISFGSGGTRNAMIGAVRQSGNNNGKLQFWTAAGANGIENRMTIDADGQVGIGTDDPEKKLHILTSTTDHTPQVLIQNGSSGDASLTFNVSGQSYVIGIDHDDSSKFKIAASGNLGTNDRVTLLSSGNVGIGTITPGRKLTVTGDASGDANNLLLSNENDTNGDSASIGFSMLSNNTYVKAGIFFQRITTQGRGDLIFANNNEVNGNNVGITNEIMSIRNTGAIEIKGTSTTLNGKAFITNTDALMTIGSTQSSGVPKDMAFFNGGERMRIQATTGNVGIRATSPTATLQIGDGTANVQHKIWGSGTAGIQIFTNSPSTGTKLIALEQYFSNEGYLGLYYNGTEKVRFRANDSSFINGGNLGIGITNPSEKLHVNGRTILQNTEHVDYATGSIDTTGVVVATVPSSTNGQSVLLTFEATGGTGSVYSVIYSCYNGGGNWYYTKNVLIFGGNIEVAETNGSGSSTLSFSFRSTSGSAAYTPRVVMKGNPYGLVSFI